MADNYVYMLGGKAYVNLTNKCANGCEFCIRNSGDGVAGTPLWLDSEPSAEQVIAALRKLEPQAREIVFCGYGEPTERMDALTGCARAFKAMGYATRLNTNGLGSLVNGRDITDELCDMDVVSVSLNAPSAEEYLAVTHSKYGLAAFDAVKKFASSCRMKGINTVFTVVDTIGEDAIRRSMAVAEELGVPLRVREYIADNYGN